MGQKARIRQSRSREIHKGLSSCGDCRATKGEGNP